MNHFPGSPESLQRCFKDGACFCDFYYSEPGKTRLRTHMPIERTEIDSKALEVF